MALCLLDTVEENNFKKHSSLDVNLFLSGPEINEKIPPAYFFQIRCKILRCLVLFSCKKAIITLVSFVPNDTRVIK